MTLQINSVAKELYDSGLVIDGLNVSNWESPAVFNSLKAGKVTAINATVATWENFPETLDNISAWGPRFRRYGDTITQIRNVTDIFEAKRNNKTGVILGFQNSSPIENRLERLELFHRLGVRIIQITYHEANLLGSGCYERYDYGLTYFGVDAVREMNRLGILIDLSHVGIQTTIDTIELSENPVSVTHANLKSHLDMPRNKVDDAMKLLAEKGGVIGATCINSMLSAGKEATPKDYVDVIDDMVEKLGIDHVGIGTDYTQDQGEAFWRYISSQQGTSFPLKAISKQSGGQIIYPKDMVNLSKQRYYPIGLETPDKLPLLTELFLAKGYKKDEISKLLGGNWLRLFKNVWQD